MRAILTITAASGIPPKFDPDTDYWLYPDVVPTETVERLRAAGFHLNVWTAATVPPSIYEVLDMAQLHNADWEQITIFRSNPAEKASAFLWFTAHLVIAFESSPGAPIMVEENIILVCGESEAEAIQKAIALGEKYAKPTGPMYHYPERSKPIFMGLRKLIAVSNDDLNNDKPPIDGSELSYELMRFDSHAAVQDFFKSQMIVASLWQPSA